MIEVVCNDRLGKKIRVKCNEVSAASARQRPPKTCSLFLLATRPSHANLLPLTAALPNRAG